MAQLGAWLVEDGFADVATHQAQGNVHLTAAVRSVADLTAELDDLVSERAGFPVETVVFAWADLRRVVDDAAELAPPVTGPDVRQQALLMREPAAPAVAAAIERRGTDDVAARVVDRVIHLWVRTGAAGDPLGFGRVGTTLPVNTMRSRTQLEDLVDRWS